MSKELIIKLFNENIKDKEIIKNVTKNNGYVGQMLEKMMSIKNNCSNSPDILGYEMKKLSSKITLGDWSASEYVFSKNRKYINDFNKWNVDLKITKLDFIKYFGTIKNTKYSWSGACVPKYNKYNDCGQIMKINEHNDLCIFYSHSKDKRKINLPDFLQKDNVLIAIWLREKLEKNVNNKYNVNGFFIIFDDKKKYNKIGFGPPFDFNNFLNSFKNGEIFFDSGLKEDENRNRSVFRAGKNFWTSLIVDYY